MLLKKHQDRSPGLGQKTQNTKDNATCEFTQHQEKRLKLLLLSLLCDIDPKYRVPFIAN